MSDLNGNERSGAIVCAQLAEAETYLQRMVSEVISLGRSLSREQFNWTPSGKAWSVGQIITHLTELSVAMTPILNKAIAEARSAGRTADGPFTYGPLTRKFLDMVGPESRQAGKRVKGPNKYTASDLDPADTLAAFEESHHDFTGCIRGADGLDLRRIKAKSAVMPIVRLPLGAWLEMTPSHIERHLLQMQDVTAAPGFPEAV